MIRKLSIGMRSSVAFSVIGLFVVFVGAFSTYHLHSLDKSMDEIVKQRSAAVEISSDYLAALYLVSLETTNILSNKDHPERLSKFIEQHAAATAHFKEEYTLLKNVLVSPEELALLEKIVSWRDQYSALNQKQIADVQAGNIKAAEDIQYGSEMMNVRTNFSQAVRDLVTYEKQKITRSAEAAAQSADSALIVVIVSIVIALAVVIGLAWVFTRSLVAPVRQVIALTESIAKGDLTHSIAVEGKDEMSQLSLAMQSMQQSLRQTIQRIQHVADQVASSSTEIQAVTNQAQEGFRQQTSELAQAASAVTQLTAAVDEVATNANQTSVDSDEADKLSVTGAKRVTETIDTVEVLNNNIVSTMANIEKLSDQVKDISSVLNVIGDIAEQTNLLALNAAIEAARAGESGRGFAVVADEVRALAHRTQESTKQIEAMSERVQSGTSLAVGSMRESNEQVQRALDVAKQAGDALAAITQTVSTIKDKNMSIAGASEEQAQVAKEVDANINHVRVLSDEIAVGAEQSNQAGLELSKLAEDLSHMARQFKV